MTQTLLQRDAPAAAAAGSTSPQLRQSVCTHHLCGGRAAMAKAEVCDTPLIPEDLKLCWVKSSFFAFPYIIFPCHLWKLLFISWGNSLCICPIFQFLQTAIRMAFC